jgi:hypothetical protein
MSTITAQQARETKIFVIENEIVEETTLFDHVCESAEEVTSPRGIMHKLFIDEKTGVIYRKIDTGIAIDEKSYNFLSDEEQSEYEYYGEDTIAWELCEWVAGQKRVVLATYDNKEDADNEWFNHTYNFDFLPDDQRDTAYWHTEDEAEAELDDRLSNQ